MEIYQGDIVWVAFPFTDGIRFKERPVLVLSRDNYNKFSKDILLVYITSQKKSTYQILIQDYHISDGELPKVCYIRYDKILLVERTRIRALVAVVTEDFYKEVVDRIFEFISMDT